MLNVLLWPHTIKLSEPLKTGGYFWDFVARAKLGRFILLILFLLLLLLQLLLLLLLLLILYNYNNSNNSNNNNNYSNNNNKFGHKHVG